MNRSNIIILIIFIAFFTIIIILLSYSIDNQNKEYMKNTALVDGIVIDITHSSWSGTHALVETPDKRYKVKCTLCMEGDKVQIETHSKRYAFIEKIYEVNTP